jgi:Type II CAAX prenyl endopeptidase Rce1-like
VTASTLAVPASRRVALRGAVVLSGAAAVVGTALLAARPALVAATGAPVPTLVALFVALLGLGVLLPLPRAAAVRPSLRVRPVVALAVGCAAFALGRAVAGGVAVAPATAFVLATNTLAAIAEEAWFRRLWFGLLAPVGPGFALVGSTVLFALVHMAIYGVWVLPLDLAAGAILGWQRWTTGSWTVPAATHVVANVLMVL